MFTKMKVSAIMIGWLLYQNVSCLKQCLVCYDTKYILHWKLTNDRWNMCDRQKDSLNIIFDENIATLALAYFNIVSLFCSFTSKVWKSRYYSWVLPSHKCPHSCETTAIGSTPAEWKSAVSKVSENARPPPYNPWDASFLICIPFVCCIQKWWRHQLLRFVSKLHHTNFWDRRNVRCFRRVPPFPWAIGEQCFSILVRTSERTLICYWADILPNHCSIYSVQTLWFYPTLNLGTQR